MSIPAISNTRREEEIFLGRKSWSEYPTPCSSCVQLPIEAVGSTSIGCIWRGAQGLLGILAQHRWGLGTFLLQHFTRVLNAGWRMRVPSTELPSESMVCARLLLPLRYLLMLLFYFVRLTRNKGFKFLFTHLVSFGLVNRVKGIQAGLLVNTKFQEVKGKNHCTDRRALINTVI